MAGGDKATRVTSENLRRVAGGVVNETLCDNGWLVTLDLSMRE